MLFLKALHLIFVVGWFAGLFYLPRLFVYHAMATEPAVREQLSLMERRLYRFMAPVAVVAVVPGLALLVIDWGYYGQAPWMYAKLVVVAALVAYHLYCGHLMRRFAAGDNRFGHVFYRWFNEAPLVLLAAIVLLVLYRPGLA